MSSRHETIGRYRKARAIADVVLVGHTLTDDGEDIDLPDLLQRASAKMRAKIAAAAAQSPPSDATWSLVCELVSIELRLRGGARAHAPVPMGAKDTKPRTLRVIPLRARPGTLSALHRN